MSILHLTLLTGGQAPEQLTLEEVLLGVEVSVLTKVLEYLHIQPADQLHVTVEVLEVAELL